MGRLRFLFVFGIMSSMGGLPAQSLDEVVPRQREELTARIRDLRPMVYNFPCKDMPGCLAGKAAADQERVKAYENLKRNYQEGLIRYFEKDFLRANAKFNDCERLVDGLFESLSQSYIDRATAMLQMAIEKRDPKDKLDLSLVDIIVEFGPGSQLRQEMTDPRETGTRRPYDPKIYRYVLERDAISSGLAKGFESLALAQESRRRALAVQQGDPAKGQLPPALLPIRIHLYAQSIRAAMQAKANAEIIFQLKYPHEMYALLHPAGRSEGTKGQAGPSASIGGVQMKWGNHPYVLPQNLRPAFDLRVPEDFRRDTVDLRSRVYEEEVERYVKLGVDPERARTLQSGSAKSP